MKNLIWVLSFIVLTSCSPADEENVEVIYKDILPELVYIEPFFNSIDEPPPPPPFQKENETDEVYALRVKVSKVEEDIKLLKEETSRGKEIHLLSKLLPIEPDSFRSAGITSIYDFYDSTWLGESLPSEHKAPKPFSSKRRVNMEAGLYDVKFIEEIPEPYTTKEQEQIRVYYLQLSDIAFDDSKSKGVFYYAVSSDGNKSGVARYAYIARENNEWRIKKVE